MNRPSSSSAIIASLFLCVLSVDAAWSAEYDAPVLIPEQDLVTTMWTGFEEGCPFRWANLPHGWPWYSSRPLGHYPSGQYHWNTMVGYQWGYFSFDSGQSFRTPPGSIAHFDFRQYTLLHNQVQPDVNGTVSDLVFKEGWMTFAPFDESLGTLKGVKIQVNMTLSTLLHLSLLDAALFHNAEGVAASNTLVMGTVGNNWPNYDVPPVGNGAYSFSLGTYTGWKEYTDWEGSFLDLLDSLRHSMEAGAWYGAPTIQDAIYILLNVLLDPEDYQQHWEPPNYNECWWFPDRRDLDHTATLTPQEYYSLVNAADGLRITLGKYDQHVLGYEAGDTYDESLYASVLVGDMRVTYDYTPIPEPAMLSLLAVGGLSMICRRRR